MLGLVVYLLIFGGFAVWASLDAKKRIDFGEGKRDVGGGPLTIFLVLLLIPIWGGALYLYKRHRRIRPGSRSRTRNAAPRLHAIQTARFTPELPDTMLAPATPTGPHLFFCSWCGSSRDSTAHSVHYCGSRQRPPAFCSACGTGLGAAAACPSCGGPSDRLSPK